MFKRKKVLDKEQQHKMADNINEQEEIKEEIEQVNEARQNEKEGAEETPEVSEVDKLKAEVATLNDKYIRLYAEFDNFKRRTALERRELLQTAGKDVIVSLLDVMDDCDRAEKQLNGSD